MTVYLPYDILCRKCGIFFENALAMATGWFSSTVLVLCRLFKTKLGLFSFKVFVKLVCPASSTTYVEPHDVLFEKRWNLLGKNYLTSSSWRNSWHEG
jgi:hypothetical protein